MTYEEMERTLVRLADLQVQNQDLLRDAVGSMRKLSDLVVSFAEQQNNRVVRLEDGLIKAEDLIVSFAEQQNDKIAQLEDGWLKVEEGLARLTALVEAFLRGSGNGGRRE